MRNNSENKWAVAFILLMVASMLLLNNAANKATQRLEHKFQGLTYAQAMEIMEECGNEY